MKKESLSVIIIKTLLAVVIFTGIGTIIIGGGYLIGDYYKYKNAINDKMIKPVIPEVTIVTDKTEYEQGETVEITVKNNLDKTILFRGLRQPCFNSFSIGIKRESYEMFYDIGTARCITDVMELKPNIEQVFRLETGDIYDTLFVLNTLIIYPETYKLKLNYGFDSESLTKTIYSNEFTIKEKVKDEIADWQTYQNEEYGFQLEYPEDFSVTVLEATKNNLNPFYQNWIKFIFEREYFGSPIIIVTGDKYIDFIVVHINEEDKGLKCLKDDFLTGKEGKTMSKKTTTKEVISESDFYREEWREGMDASHFFNYRTVYNDKCFMMTTNLEDSYPNNSVKMELYDKIIHSFKFIEK